MSQTNCARRDSRLYQRRYRLLHQGRGCIWLYVIEVSLEFFSEFVFSVMARHKHKNGEKKQQTHGQQGSSTGHTTPHTPKINRTRSKLPTKRKLQRQQDATSAVPPPDTYEHVVSLPQSPPRSDMEGGTGKPERRRGRKPKRI